MNLYYILLPLIGIFLLFLIFKKQIRVYCQGAQCRLEADLSQKVVIITGGNTGIGYHTALRLIENGANVIIACRSEKRGKNAEKQIKNQSKKNKNIFYMNLDLSDLKSVEKFAKEFKEKYNRLDILINNAGVLFLKNREVTTQGFETTVGVNHIGHFHLTNLLKDILEKTSKQNNQVRVINVSSIAHMTTLGKIDWTNFMGQKSYDMKTQYAYSKLANIYFTKYLSTQNENQNIKYFSLHPGLVNTELYRRVPEQNIMGFLFKLFQNQWLFFSKTSQDGAQTSIYLCLEDFDKLKCGAYYVDCKQQSLVGYASDNEEIEKLWRYSNTMINGAIQDK